jgi:NADPH:quinone reductase-like Zn-dependent oxidoreductase
MAGIDTARQFWIQAPGRGEIIELDVGPRQDGEVLVRALYSGISRGTESLVFRGEVPPSQYQAMRAPFQAGDFPSPVKYGYASVGEVLEGGDSSELVGRTVFCLYPHQDRYWVPAEAVTPLPADVPPARAVLAASMETAINITWDAQSGVGDHVVVIGAGVVGLLAGWLVRNVPGVVITVVDPDPARESVARALGLTWRAEAPTGIDADIVIHASGHPEGLRTALAVAGVESTVVEASWYGSSQASLPLGEHFHSRRLTIRSSQVGRIPPLRAPRWTRARRMCAALGLLRAPELDVLISGESPFAALPEVMSRLSQDACGELCHRISYV